jgi:hypothetical protein
MPVEYIKVGNTHFLKSAVENKTFDELKDEFPNQDESLLLLLAVEKPEKPLKGKKVEGGGAL